MAARELATISSRGGRRLPRVDRPRVVAGRLAASPRSLRASWCRWRVGACASSSVTSSSTPTIRPWPSISPRPRATGFRLNVNLLGEAVLGEAEAAARRRARPRCVERARRRLRLDQGVRPRLARSRRGTPRPRVARVLGRLRPLYRAAMPKSPHAFVNLDMEEYRDLDLTLEVFGGSARRARVRRTRGGDRAAGVPAGLRGRARSPDRVRGRERSRAGGARLKVRLVKGANLSMEQVEAELHGWVAGAVRHQGRGRRELPAPRRPIAPPRARTACCVSVSPPTTCTTSRSRTCSPQRRGVSAALDVEMLQGMSPAQARAVRDDGRDGPALHAGRRAGGLRRRGRLPRAPARGERREPQNFLYALFADDGTESREGPSAAGTMADQEARFRASVAAMATTSQHPRRTPRPSAGGTDASPTPPTPIRPLPRRAAVGRGAGRPASRRRSARRCSTSIGDVDACGRGRSRRRSPAGRRRPAAERAAILRRAADALEARRGDLVDGDGHEAGKTVAEADPEVTEAIDFARYYADRAIELEPSGGHASTDGASLHADRR